ncbi:3-hydroxyacyl-ACP dehydratase FabZ [Paraclostridium sordellii]|uniref:3-hydroxyacyl-[acyl-carrier-protein] dehydratase FabZ n=1 Tax=Paraclostridium sordellii TaxID=1505 RepID=A0A0C7GEN0_PARSO|nr:3-hydroxyacyl-ACP dehydratase FabZ [Paeniclostridium sordellii]QYE97910.1 3-hydroxyacyl-ACP dehydratase FabZ [Paeniclostridium sordellii]CEN80386.1 (3R)-hydroxymyristoyl-ACP dehydratase [[Clostridium] sordellii] [Paeniclostridium sordellii]CEO14525.1 (3R)-hydroxymyristoyl-ACP dehydratase [[Clostridium] sordellii] [Paeniclostridium sordellii]CEP89714.1 (3R)-hydroxymyristoyl-ACP dehydratase [[Clostridium] sordellii] [Paeniclostridium sordellii]CEP98285.1 (3R)-hydroxymyristoyl-ACP dehydratase 
MLNIDQIKDLIPHRYPFLLVDRVLELEEGKRAVGIKNVSVNEPFFQGHFPDYPIMPGVLIIEAMAQVGAVAMMSMDENKGKLGVFAGIDKVRFKKEVRPGDTLRMEVEMLSLRRNIGKANASAYVDDDLVCSGELMFALVQK